MPRRPTGTLPLLAFLTLLNAAAASAAIEVLDAFYRPDRMLPEWNYFYSSNYKPGDTPPTINASGALCIYVKNTGTGSVTIDDVTINGTGLKNGIRFKEDKLYRCDAMAASVYYPSPANPRQALVDAGVPIWWRVDPNPVPAGGFAEVYVRMRTRVLTTLSLSIVPTSGSATPASITVTNNETPRIAGYYASTDYTKLYLYLRHPIKGTAPTQILIDGVDRTASCTIGSDADFDIVPVKCNLAAAFSRGSFHLFQAVYADGAKASHGLRVYSDDFKYGTWGCPSLSSTTEKAAHVDDLGRHSFNLLTMGVGDLSDYLNSSEGKAKMDAYGIRKAHDDVTADRLYAYFLCDEPDVGEYNVANTVAPTAYDRVGTLAQDLSNRAVSKKTNYSQYPSMINIDETYKPYNYYIYGHLADVLSTDPYYTQVLCSVFWDRPWQIPVFTKATYEYAHAATANAGCEPRPLHVILNACRYQDATRVFRWGTPEEKHIEAYYAIAGGAKQLAYWWLTEIGPSASGYNGLGNRTEPGSAALWREAGLIGAEVGTASQLLVNSCPAQVPITCSGRLWLRALVSGIDTVVLVCVNDDYANDEAGTIIRPIDSAEVSLDLPSWLTPTQVFEVDYRGVRDASHGLNGSKIDIHLGRFDVARMVIITKDSALKSTLQSLYTTKYGPRVNQLIPAQ